MPELAEVEFFRKQWNPGVEETVASVHAHPRARIFRYESAEKISDSLVGRCLEWSAAQAKQMAFRFAGNCWLGIHLGMSGKLSFADADYEAEKWDHLVLRMDSVALVFSDPRQFGALRMELPEANQAPKWWQDIAPPVLSDAFTPETIHQFLERRSRSPIKAVLLMQETFPGIGNWMADEILWRARIHPKQPAGSLSAAKRKNLFAAVREVAADALRVIGESWGNPPDDWLFNHRWKDGGTCPVTGCQLVRETVGGRTTCWSPRRQRLTTPI